MEVVFSTIHTKMIVQGMLHIRLRSGSILPTSDLLGTHFCIRNHSNNIVEDTGTKFKEILYPPKVYVSSLTELCLNQSCWESVLPDGRRFVDYTPGEFSSQDASIRHVADSLLPHAGFQQACSVQCAFIRRLAAFAR